MKLNLDIQPLSSWIKTGAEPLLIAGPCSAETEEQLVATAHLLANTGRVSALRAEAVELAVLNATDERVPFVRREAENCACSVPAVPDANFAAGQARYLNAVTVRETQRALHPFGLTFERRHSLATPH